MDFLGIGIWEVLLILVVALIIWGPGRIVEISIKLGRMLGRLRRASSELTAQLTREIESERKDTSDSTTSQDKSGGKA